MGEPLNSQIYVADNDGGLEMAPYANGLECVKRALRRRWPDAEYASLLEFMTGYGERSGGKRRPHWNLRFKGVPAAALYTGCIEQRECDQLHDSARKQTCPTGVAARVWCEHVDAERHVQRGRAIYAYGGLVKYLGLHLNKASQQPPAGFTGQRFNCSRGYFTGCDGRRRVPERAVVGAQARAVQAAGTHRRRPADRRA